MVEEDLLLRASESHGNIEKSLQKYNRQSRVKLQVFCDHLAYSQLIKVQNALGLFSDQIVELVKVRLSQEIKPLRPLALKLDSGDGKDLLTQNLEEGRIPRRWSKFYQVDPVELYRGSLAMGKGEFACEYAGRVFLFDSEPNLLEFLSNPKPYLKKTPQLPSTFNIALVGMRETGKRTFAKLLH